MNAPIVQPLPGRRPVYAVDASREDIAATPQGQRDAQSASQRQSQGGEAGGPQTGGDSNAPAPRGHPLQHQSDLAPTSPASQDRARQQRQTDAEDDPAADRYTASATPPNEG